ncbi:hypothetical protein HOY82DRAFT_546490 [Tuber indicum]|nr:hypothetical protein HOY82DRAFT_546490 [Tuber indicum]
MIWRVGRGWVRDCWDVWMCMICLGVRYGAVVMVPWCAGMIIMRVNFCETPHFIDGLRRRLKATLSQNAITPHPGWLLGNWHRRDGLTVPGDTAVWQLYRCSIPSVPPSTVFWKLEAYRYLHFLFTSLLYLEYNGGYCAF